MKRSAMVAVARKYALLLEVHGAIVEQARLHDRLNCREHRPALLNHARWQVEMVCRVADRIGGEVTAIRLLGSAQGILMATGVLTVAEVWRDNTDWLDGASVRAFESAAAELNGV